MEELLTQFAEHENNVNSFEGQEPVAVDNSLLQKETEPINQAQADVQTDGESLQKDPQKELILGKFKSVEDLSKAYEELQKHQGISSAELGELRKRVTSIDSFFDKFQLYQKFANGIDGSIKRDKEKYNSPEYFQDPTFREIYREAYSALGDNLDTDRFINLLETYVKSRIFANERLKAAKQETQQVIDSMEYNKNPKSSIIPPKKRFDEMNQQEINDLIDRLI